MAGVAGRSGGHNRKMSTLEDSKKILAPSKEDRAKAEADWFIRDVTNVFTVDELFDILADKLHKYGITTKDDGMMLSQLAVQYHILQEAYREYHRHGIDHKIGTAMVTRVITEAQKEITILLREFCLTPKTRGQRPDKESTGDDPFNSLMNFTH